MCMTVQTHMHPRTHKGDLIDRIEHNVQNTCEYVEYGRKQIRKAAQYKKKRRVSIAAVKRGGQSKSVYITPWNLKVVGIYH